MYLFEYRCSRCRLEPDVCGTGIWHQYKLPDGRVTGVPTKTCWCHDCGGLRKIETLDVEYWQQELQLTLKLYASVSVQIPSTDHRTYTYLYEWRGQSSTYELEMSDLATWNAELTQATAGYELLIMRQSPPHCLMCGGTNFETEAWLHPSCGGTFEERQVGHMMLMNKQEPEFLSIEGRSLVA